MEQEHTQSSVLMESMDDPHLEAKKMSSKQKRAIVMMMVLIFVSQLLFLNVAAILPLFFIDNGFDIDGLSFANIIW